MSELKVDAAAVLVIDRMGQVLGATRRGTSDEWGLIGGSCDANETPLECARREFKEETGVTLGTTPTLIFEGWDDHENYCHIYLAGDTRDIDACIEKFGQGPVPIEDFFVSFIAFNELLRGPFKEFNSSLLATLLSKLVSKS